MQTGLAPANRAWLRDWSARYVRGGALLPTLLIGAQPYGLLPVSRVGAPPRPVGRVEHSSGARVAGATWDDSYGARGWTRSRRRRAGRGGARGARLKILGGVPHPIAFSLQRVDDKRAGYTSRWDVKLGLLMLGAAVRPEHGRQRPLVVTVPTPGTTATTRSTACCGASG